ncbi:MAG TPA: response regulator transcription factor [Dermatophilaceae bacterium]|nr:response regulator transcription factor [Dermatophilaceae bacterium]
MAALRILLVEDSTLFREGLATLLTAAGMVVVAQLRSPAALDAVLGSNEVDVVITDVCLPPTMTDEGVLLARRVRQRFPEVGVMLLSTYSEPSWARELLDLGPSAVGYLLKDRVEDVAGFVAALHRVAAGGVVLDESIVASLVFPKVHRSPMSTLTEREREVLALMAEGLTNQAISIRLMVAERTVESHIAGIFAKLPVGPEDVDHNRRVLAVLRYLQDQNTAPRRPSG